MKFLGIMLLLAGVSSFAMAGAAAAPEISPASGVGALALLSGGLLVIRGRSRK
jgi:hypothetical protein